MKAFFASAFVALFSGAFLWLATDGFQAITTESARRIHVARNKPLMPQAMLETMSGRIQALHPGGEEVVVAEFIYTTCPFICVTGGGHLERLQQKIAAEGLDDKVRIVSISFDPDNDEPAQLAQYARRYNADGKIWTIARPLKKDLPDLLRAFGVVVIADEFGGFQHNVAMHVMDRDGRLAAIFDEADVTGAFDKIREILR